MNTIGSFTASFKTGLVPCDVGESSTGLRLATWISAKDIPTDVLRMMGYEDNSPYHPHNLDGLAWDMGKNEWRNMKNAQVRTSTFQVIDMGLRFDIR